MIHTSDMTPVYKRFTVDKELLKMDFYLQFTRYLRTLRLTELGCTLLDTYSHLPPTLLASLHPDVQQAIDYSAVVKQCFADDKPAPSPPPGMGSLPVVAPSHPGPPSNGMTAVALKNREVTIRAHEEYEAAKIKANVFLLSLLDDTDLTALKRAGGTTGLLFIEASDIWKHIMGDRYANPTAAQISKHQALITQDFQLDISLASNFDRMKTASEVLATANPALAYADNALFREAIRICSSNKYRLIANIHMFTSVAGYNYLEATFDNFATHMIALNASTIYDPSTSCKAFCGDPDYVPRMAGSNFAMAAPSTSPGQRHRRTKGNHPSPTATVSVTPKLCFFHGWQPSHDSTECKRMAHDSTFTAAQKALVCIPVGHPINTPFFVDGAECNQIRHKSLGAAP
jgi:hypothetical protein